MIWKDILPECLNAISPTDNVKHCGTEMSSGEYKEQCVRTLCQCNWSEGQLVQLAAMFNDMQLSRNDHKQVVNKICTYIIDFPPDTLPALVHQLLKLCQTHDFDIVLSHLSHYLASDCTASWNHRRTMLPSKIEPVSTMLYLEFWSLGGHA
ncbi:Fanconi anemia group I protein homolog [Choristoneura fumiferana]|uniref:Fanconi anemia group I protein homolog n=1 Tax=Choristoneura fumiferana TaxID=7141 RepID=UPI003D157EC1